MSSLKSIAAIAQRELKAYFVSPLGYVVTALVLASTGFLFALILVQSREASLRPAHSNLSVVLLFVMPFITMRLLAEEQRTGTIELLLTNPVREFEVVLGKFIGGLLFFCFMLACTLFYPALIYLLGGQPDVGPMVGGYLGLLLQGAAFLAVGLVASSLTENQIIAAIMTFAVLLVLWLADSFGQNIGPPMSDVFRYLSVTQQFQDFPRGIVDTTHVVYFLSLVAGCLVIATLCVQSRRWR